MPLSSRALPRLPVIRGAAVLLLALGLGCPAAPPPAAPARDSTGGLLPYPVRFVDVTREAGIDFVHHSGAYGRKFLPETMGSGLVFFDYDADNDPDLFFVDGAEWPDRRQEKRYPALYRNRGDGTFEEVAGAAGLAEESYGIGAAAGDYDNDGYPDLFINALGPDRLYHNRGDGTFEEVAARAGVSDPAFGSSAAWLDYDRDGRLDLFAGNYVQWTPATDIFCTLDGVNKSYCTPESYQGATNRLFRNRGDGTFEDVTRRAGLYDPSGKTLGVVALDYDSDGWTDLAVANDTHPNFLYRNLGDGTFQEVGVRAGIAFGEDGKARGAMGIDAGDYDRSGRESLIIGNFANEMLGLYRNSASGVFLDEAPEAGLGEPSLLTLAFGCFFFDFDLDGRLDIFVANGHVETDIGRVQPTVGYAEPAHLFRGLESGRFAAVTSLVGDALSVPRVGRGAALADIDGDGDLDVAMSANNGPAVLFRNDGGNANRWIRLRLSGKRSARDAVGAVARIRGGDGAVRMATVRAGSSYASQSELALTFGFGPPAGAPATVDVEITWPDGARQNFTGLAPGRLHALEERP